MVPLIHYNILLFIPRDTSNFDYSGPGGPGSIPGMSRETRETGPARGALPHLKQVIRIPSRRRNMAAKVVIGVDHGALEIKKEIVDHLVKRGYEITDVGVSR